MSPNWKLRLNPFRRGSDRPVPMWVYAVAAGFTSMHTGVAPAEAASRMRPRAPLPEPIRGHKLYVAAQSTPGQRAEDLSDRSPLAARLLAHIAEQSQAEWFGDWNQDVRRDVGRVLDAAEKDGGLPVLVAYNIPNRDCGQWSAGGAQSLDDYRSWIEAFADGIGDRNAAVIVEPDALAALECLSPEERRMRIAMLRTAVDVIKERTNASVYLDAGHPTWHAPATVARRIQEVGGKLDGFALNVSNTQGTERNIQYGEEVSKLTNGLHFVIDTSRNGVGAPSDGEWCNPRGRALGRAPSTDTGHPLVDAFLWIKRPGESDGECNGGPPAGQWYEDYAIELAQNAQDQGLLDED